jgi:FPC/CPF motif-containing protein YcgG
VKGTSSGYLLDIAARFLPYRGMIGAEQQAQIQDDQLITREYLDYIENKEFPCVAAKAAAAKQQVHCMVATHMACPKDDHEILQFIYSFVDEYRQSGELYHSAAIIFQQPTYLKEAYFEELFWQRLQSISDMDARNFGYDKRVDIDPSSPNFSFSLKQEAFFIIGLHPESSRVTRQFKYPTLVFNPHLQFEQLRETSKYSNLKHVVRKRDVAYSGSINPMLTDFGDASEVFQYSGVSYNSEWKCPLKIRHEQS